jgi:hypothetical protein
VLNAGECFVLKTLWVQPRITSCQSAPPARNSSPRTPHSLPVAQHHRTPCLCPKTQSSQAVAGWRVRGLVMTSAGRREETWRKIRDLKKRRSDKKYVVITLSPSPQLITQKRTTVVSIKILINEHNKNLAITRKEYSRHNYRQLLLYPKFYCYMFR